MKTNKSTLEYYISEGAERWASYEQLLEINRNLLCEATEEAQFYCCDAVNLVFELKSSTSGMYAKWHIFISPECTVYLDRPQPKGISGTFNGALADFILKSRTYLEKNPPKEPYFPE